MATCSSCGKVCIIVQERSFTTAADSCDVQLTLDDSQTPGVLSASLVVDDDPTNLLVPGTCGWSVPEAAVISVIDANICTILSDQSISCFGDVDTTTTPPTSGQFMAWNGTQWVPTTLPAGTAVNVEDANGNFTVLNGNGNIPTDTLDVISGKVELDKISQTYNTGASSGFTAMANGTFVLATTADVDLTPIHQNMSENFYLDPTAYFNYSIGTTTNYVFSTEYSTNSGATWSNWEVGSTISIAPGGPSTGNYYLTANDDPINSTAPSTVRFRSTVTVSGYNGGNILSTLLRVRGIGVVGVKI
jgi:hypothetical protein